MNWTKVGLKAILSGARSRQTIGLNWTKVGLKVCKAREQHSLPLSLNWTKVGLKAFFRNRGVFELRKFELD